MEGLHYLSIMHKDAHIYGSPFQFTVGSFTEGGAHKVEEPLCAQFPAVRLRPMAYSRVAATVV